MGPVLAFERLWRELGLAEVIGRVGSDRQFSFDPKRALFLAVPHRMMDPGSHRAAEKRKRDVPIEGSGPIELHQLYGAIGWLGSRRRR